LARGEAPGFLAAPGFGAEEVEIDMAFMTASPIARLLASNDQMNEL